MDEKIPVPLIAVIADVFSSYYTGTRIDSQFFAAGFPGEPPEGNKEQKCHKWLLRANKESHAPLKMVGLLLQEMVETVPRSSPWGEQPSDLGHRDRILAQLSKLGLSYQTGGYIVPAGASAASQTLKHIVSERDLKGVQVEFDRILANIESDPPAAVTASCALLEALFKTYIADEGLKMPSDESVLPLWKEVRAHLKLDPTEIQDDSLKKILSGLASITDGIAALRTRRGSAHGHDVRTSFRIEARHARVAAHSAFTLATFFLEVAEARKTRALK